VIKKYSARFAVVMAGSVALLAVGAASAAASGLCPGTCVAAFKAPDVYLTPDTTQSTWSSPVTILPYREDLSIPNDESTPLSNITVMDGSMLRTNQLPDLGHPCRSTGWVPLPMFR
jgi:hypothetical protein